MTTLPTDPLEQDEAAFEAWWATVYFQHPRTKELRKSAFLAGRASVFSPRSEEEREAVARLIDPKVWADEDWKRDLVKRRVLHDNPQGSISQNTEATLAKADAIISLLRGKA